jgi:ribonuclease Y
MHAFSPYLLLIGGIALALFFGILFGFFLRKKFTESRVESIETLSKKIVEEAKKEAETVKKEAMLQAKDSLYQMKMEFEKETKERKQEILEQDKRLLSKEQNLERKAETLEKRELEIEKKERQAQNREKELGDQKERYERLIVEKQQQLEQLAGISSQEAKDFLMQSLENEAKHEAAKTMRRIEQEAREAADKKAKDIISLAIKR